VWWLQPVPRARWLLAVALVSAAFVADVRGPDTRPYPFAATELAQGTDPKDADIEWPAVPTGLLPEPDLSGRLRVGVVPGTPLIPALLGAEDAVPDGWWIVDVPMPAATAVGSDVRLVVLDPPTSVEGVVAGPAVGDPFGGALRAPVAVPAASADMVARAVATDGVVALRSGLPESGD